MNQFIKGLSNECRTHTIALGTNSFAQESRTALLYESAKTFGHGDSTSVLQKQETNSPVQDYRTLEQVHSRIKCVYCKRDGHQISDCRTRQSNNQCRGRSRGGRGGRTPPLSEFETLVTGIFVPAHAPPIPYPKICFY